MNSSLLEALFESEIKVRLLRLFFSNPNEAFTLDDIINLIKTDPSSTRYHLRKLRKIRLLKSDLRHLTVAGKDSAIKGKKRRVYQVNQSFPNYDELRRLVLSSEPVGKGEMVKRLLGIGRVRYAILSGLFVNDESARIDMLVVSDDIDAVVFQKFINQLEAEVGHEVRYTLMSTEEFQYRLNMYDNFLRRVLSQKHEVLVDSIRLPSIS